MVGYSRRIFGETGCNRSLAGVRLSAGVIAGRQAAFIWERSVNVLVTSLLSALLAIPPCSWLVDHTPVKSQVCRRIRRSAANGPPSPQPLSPEGSGARGERIARGVDAEL